jgi:DeoR/GlpR family transcriptional regulator of sugar metabolism
MLAAERRQYILECLQRDGRVLANDLSAELKVSEDTIRRDLREMASEGLLQRVHGGALRKSPALVNYKTREAHLTDQKMTVAKKAATLIQDGMVVLMGGGTTNVQTANFLPPTLKATIITHSPNAAVALADHPAVEIILLGGSLYKHARVTVGAEPIDKIRQIRADLCLLGICSLCPTSGISLQDYEESLIHRAMIDSSAEVAALASAEKMGTAAPFIVGGLDLLNYIITDSTLSEELLAPYRQFNLEIL